MRVNEKMKKALSILLCLCMLLQNAPVMVFAATTDNLCDHHTEHTAECGYREGSAGSACTHKHSEGCYKIVACKHTHDDTCSSGCTHNCTVENGCITMALDCHHTHGDCGYAEAVAPQECTTCQSVLNHAENCGYVAPVAEVTCACVPGEDGTLVHTEGCGYVAPVEEVKCACVPTVTHGGEGCTYAEGKAGAPCTHTHAVKVDSDDSCYKLLCSHKDGGHDDACGYVASVSGSDCTFHCHICHVQELVDALPGEVTAENAEAVAAQLTAIDNEKASLSDEELVQVDFAKYTAAAEGLGSVYAAVPATDFAVNIAEATNGKVEADKTTATEGDTITLTVTANEGYELDTLTVMNGETAVEINDNSFIMPAASVTVTATFKAVEAAPATYSVTIAETTNGTVAAKVNDSEVTSAAENDIVTLTVEADDGYKLDSLTVMNGETEITVTDNTFTMPAANVTVTATFKAVEATPTTYTVTIAESIENGTVTANPTSAEAGATVTLTVTPAEGYEIDTVSYNDGADHTIAPVKGVYSFTMPAGDVTVTATFKIPVCTCTDKCAEGSLNSECAVCSADGAALTACIGGSVAKVGNTYYTDFATAVANWTDNTTLTLLADVTDLAEQIELSGNGLVLDLNGKKLEATVDDAFKITAGEMTIRDSAGTGSFTTTQDGVLWLYGGNVNFESGTLESVTISKGTFNMTGGTIQAEAFTGIYVTDDEGTANISGGEIRVTDNNREAIYNGFGTLNVSGNVVITSTSGYAIQNSSASVLTTISGDVALNGSDGEFYLAKAIVLNTQPAGDTRWRVNINTDSDSGIENGVFAIPGDGVTLDPAKFTSLIDGYEVKLNNKNELVLCNHSAATVAVSNGNETHNTTCDCNGTTFESNIACSGGVATATHLAVCAYCGGTYGELDANVNYDIIATAMTAAELKDAVTAWLADGNTDISILLTAYADQEMFTAIWTAFSESTAADGSINLTISGAKTVPEYGFFDNDNYLENGKKNIAGDKLKSLTLTDVETIGDCAFSACTYLESVNLPQVVTVGFSAFNQFKKGTKLTSLNLPNATTIGDWAFAYSSLLTSVNLPKVVTIGTVAFSDCDLRTLDLPEATTIGSEAFMNNDNLVSCSAPKATTIGYHSWGSNGTSKLERLELTAVGDFTLSNNIIAYTPTEQIDLVLNKDKETQVTQNEDGTATWATTIPYGDSLTYTFKSITLTCVDGTTNHTYKYTDMSNGTHKAECTVEGCGFYKYEAHTPDADGYTVNEDGTHSLTCTVCQTAVNEAHTFTNGVCSACDYVCPHSNFDSATGNCKDCETSLAIAKIKTGETTTYYLTADELRTAVDFNSAYADQTITLLADFAVIMGLDFNSPSGVKNTLDLNGHTLTYSNPSERIDVESGELTITGPGSINIFMTSDNEGAKIVVGSGVMLNDTLRSVYGGVLDLTYATIPEAGLNVILYTDDWKSATYNVSDVLLLPEDYYFFVDSKAVYTYSVETKGTVLKHTDHSYTYTDNGDGTHDATCSACGKMVDNEAHTFDQNDAGEWVCDCTAKAVASVTIENLTAYYANFADAVTMWAEHGDILTLLADVSYDSTINLGVNVSRTFVGGDYTLDLGSNNIVNYGTLTIQSGTIKTQFDTALAVYGPTTINSDNAELQGKSFQIMVHKPEALSITGTGCDGWRIWNNYNTQEAPITIPEGFHLEDEDGNQLAANDKLPVWEITVIKANHVHNWSYTADGSTITATCNGNIGTCPDAEQSFTLNAPDAGYSGNPVEAEVTRDCTDLTFTLHYTGTNYDSADAPTNVGDYTVTMTVGDKSVSDTFTISPKDISVVQSVQFSLSQDSFTYSGKAPALNVTGVDSSVGSYTMQKGTDYTVGTVEINAGSHTFTVTGIGNYTGTAQLDYTITAKEVSITGAAIQAVTYDPNGYTLTVTGVTFDGVVEGEDLAYTATAELTGTNAFGEQDATVTVTLNNSNYTLATATYQTKVTINKAAATVTAAPTPQKTLTYTGSAQNLINGGEATGGEMQYSTNNQTWSTDIPKGTDAGEYTVYYKVIGDANHSDTDVKSVTVTIAKAQAVITVDTATITVTYGDTVTLPTATTNFGTVVCDKTADDLVNAGTYTVTYSVEGTGNFQGATKTLTVKVEQLAVAEPTVTGTYTYSGREHTAQLTGVESYMTVASGNKGTNAGNYEVEVTLDGNHKWADGSDGRLQWTIAKAKAEISVNTDPITVTYGETVTLPTATTNFGDVVCNKKASDIVNADTYTVTYTVAGTDNYDGDTKSITVIVNAKPITVTADALSKTYGDADPKLTYKVEGLVNGDELTGELKRVAGENVGSYAIEQNTLTAGDNYTITYTGANLTINAKAITEADVELNGSLTYTGKELTQPITVTEGITYTVTGDKATDVGTYELTVKGTGNYTGEVKLSWSIKETAAVVTKAPAAKTLTYTGEAQALVNAGTTADGKLVYSLTENGEFTENIPTGTNAGEYTVWYYVQGDDNHSDSAKASVKVTIAKADPVIGTVGCEMDLYDSTAISNVELTRTDMSVEGTLVLTDSELTAGEGTYNWKFTPKDTNNYNTITGTVVLNVTADVLEKIEASGTLEKDSYSYGDTFSIDGLTVTATYTTGATKDVTELVSFDNTLAVGQTSVELTYQGKTYTVTGFTVAKKQLVISGMAWDIPENAVYSGTAYNATLTGNLPEGVTVTKTGDTATNAGDYTAKAVFSLAEGYSADNYEIVNGEDLTADWTVAKKNIAGATITLGTALTYNGKQQTQTVTKVEIDGLTVTYTVSGNTGTDAKGYTLTVTGNGNFEGTATADWSIAKKNISGATITLGDSLTYIGNEQTQEVADVKIGDLTVTYDVTANKQLGAGNYTLTVTGNGNFEGSATADWSIAKAKLTITANNNSITYGDVPAANGVTGTGFVSSESIEDLSGELTYSYNYEQFGNVGTYKITPSGVTSNNYEITFADGTLTVNAKAITVTADAVSKTYGDADPKLTYKVEGLVNGDELTGELKRVAGENVGDYAIEQNTLTAGNNYRLAYTGAKLTINAKAITAADVKLNCSLTYNGKEQTQAITVTEGITYEVTGNKATNVGTYELTVKGTGNYTGSVTLDWTITKAKLTITADSKVIYIGEKLPTLTYTVSGLVGGDKLTKEPALTTNADADQAGSYTITAANADAGMNYAITYVGGTLTIMDKNTEVETKVETAALTEVPDGLKNTKFNTVEAIKQELTSRIVATSTGFVKENMAHYDVTLQFSLDGGETWILATEENFPTEGITVTLPYPYGTNAAGYDFVVSHMFTVTSQRLGTTAGDVELPSVTETASGIRVTLKGLSPVTLAWRATEFDVKIAGTTNGTVSTNVSKAASGTEVTVTVTPKYGYKMATLTVKDANGKSYAVSTDNSGKYYFTMPAADVTVTATFSKISSSTADTTNPKTGDNFQLMLWSSILSTSAIFLLAALADQKRKLIE